MESQDREREDDITRVSREVASRLTALGISLKGDESSDDLRSIADAVEDFERAVESNGGDLMMAEPPSGGGEQADSSSFALPRRAADESVTRYVERVRRAADEVTGGQED